MEDEEYRHAAAAPETPEPPPIVHDPESKASEKRGYNIGKWMGRNNYECLRCSFSTLDSPLIDEHVAKAHQPPKPAITSVIYGPDGNRL